VSLLEKNYDEIATLSARKQVETEGYYERGLAAKIEADRKNQAAGE